jgi:hypothetical protein
VKHRMRDLNLCMHIYVMRWCTYLIMSWLYLYKYWQVAASVSMYTYYWRNRVISNKFEIYNYLFLFITLRCKFWLWLMFKPLWILVWKYSIHDLMHEVRKRTLVGGTNDFRKLFTVDFKRTFFCIILDSTVA